MAAASALEQPAHGLSGQADTAFNGLHQTQRLHVGQAQLATGRVDEAVATYRAVTARAPSGASRTAGKHTMARMIGSTTGKARLWASWTVFTAAPIDA